MSFGCLQFFQKTKENNWGTIVVWLNFFVRFLEELKIVPKRHFEINWPLEAAYFLTSLFFRWALKISFCSMTSTLTSLRKYDLKNLPEKIYFFYDMREFESPLRIGQFLSISKEVLYLGDEGSHQLELFQ